MKKKSYVCNLILAVLVGSVLAVFLLCKTFFPALILPAWDIPLLLGLSLVALVVDHWLAPDVEREWVMTTLLAVAVFGLLPLCAGLASPMLALKLAAVGGAAYVISAILLDSALHRLSAAPWAPIPVAFVLFLAGQCFTNILF